MAQITGYTVKQPRTITLTLVGDVGETAWTIEANRSPDFAADESITRGFGSAGAATMRDLVPDTPYYFRARKTNGGNGPWSATYMTATAPPASAPNPPYTGFSIVPAILVVPEPLGDLAMTNIDAGSLASSMTNDDPMSLVRVAGPDNTTITFRTPGRPIDTFAILGTLAHEDIVWRIRGAATLADVTGAPVVDTGNVQFRISPGIGRRKYYHAFRRLSQTYTLEFWQIDISGFAQFFVARNLVVGLARSSVNISRGAGQVPLDFGKVDRTIFGTPDRVVGWRGRNVEFPLSWITEAEYEAKWRDLDQLVGLTDPVLALPNPKANVYLNDRIAFGEIGSARGEIMRGDRWLKSLEIRSLY